MRRAVLCARAYLLRLGGAYPARGVVLGHLEGVGGEGVGLLHVVHGGGQAGGGEVAVLGIAQVLHHLRGAHRPELGALVAVVDLRHDQRARERAGLLQTGVQDADRSVPRAVRRGTSEELEWRAATHRPLERPVDVLLHVAEPLRVVVLGVHHRRQVAGVALCCWRERLLQVAKPLCCREHYKPTTGFCSTKSFFFAHSRPGIHMPICIPREWNALRRLHSPA